MFFGVVTLCIFQHFLALEPSVESETILPWKTKKSYYLEKLNSTFAII